MQCISRREVLSSTGFVISTALAGCSGSDGSSSDGDAGGSREQVIDSREEIAEDEYQYFTFDINRQADFEYDFRVRSGPEIDAFLVDDQEFDEFQAGNRFQVYSSEFGTSGGDTLTLGEDSYRLVMDNTNAGEVAPPTNIDDDVAEVEVEAWVEG